MACKKVLIIEHHNGSREMLRGKEAIGALPKYTSAAALQGMLEGYPMITSNGCRMWIECEEHHSDRANCIFS